MEKHLGTNGHKGVAPIIATLLMVAIAVVGGILIFVFAQGFFNQTQVNSTPQIESLGIVGYDARTGTTTLNDTYGNVITGVAGGVNAGKLAAKDNIFIYVKNNGVKPSVLSTVQLAGITYAVDTTTAANTAPSSTTPVPASATPSTNLYCLMDQTQKCITGTAQKSAVLQPGGIYTVVLNLPYSLKAGRDIGVILTTSLTNVFQGTIVIGQNQG